MPGRDPKKFSRPQVDIGKNLLSREARAKKALEKYERAEKVKVQDEKDMLNVQGAKDGGRIGLKHGSYKDKANPHIDQQVYVTKSGKEEESVVDKDSVIKNKKRKRMPEGSGKGRAENPPKRKPGEEKIMTPLAKGGRAMLRGGGICKRGMNKKAVGKNS